MPISRHCAFLHSGMKRLPEFSSRAESRKLWPRSAYMCSDNGDGFKTKEFLLINQTSKEVLTLICSPIGLNGNSSGNCECRWKFHHAIGIGESSKRLSIRTLKHVLKPCVGCW